MVPLVFFPSGSNSMMLQAIGLCVFGGLTSSTLMTLFFIPVLYTVINERSSKKAEIIANSSVQEELIETVENVRPDFQYTLVPTVHGKGRTNLKLGTVTWPELNFLIISYIEDSEVERLRSAITGLKGRFSNEGIKLFMIPEIS